MKMQPFKAFISLIEFDQKIRSLLQHMHDVEQGLEALHTEYADAQQALDAAANKVHGLRKVVDAQELEMKVLDEQEQEKRTQLESIADQRVFQSVKKEIDYLKSEQHNAELALLDAWNKLETAQREFAGTQEASRAALEGIEKKIADKKQDLAQKKAEHAALENERPVQGVPEEWLERYENMRLTVADPVVPIEGESCSACFGAIINQDMMRLKRKAVVPCKHCFRLLYSKEAMQHDLESDE